MNVTGDVATLSTNTNALPSDVNDNIALIGGIVGGIVGLLLVGGLIAFLVTRSRRPANDEPNNDAALQSVRPNNDPRHAGVASHRTNYDSLILSAPENSYVDVAISPPKNYDAWSANDDSYAARPSPNHTDYEDFTKVR
jgi:hypothetical protein